MPVVSVWPLISFSVSLKKAVPLFSKDNSSQILNSCRSLFRDEPLLEEWYSWTFPMPNAHSNLPQDRLVVFHRSSWPCRNGSHVVRCFRRYVEIVVPCRFCILLTFLVNWRTGSLCKELLRSFTVLGNRFSFVVASSSRMIVGIFWILFFLMRRFHRCFSIHPPRYASFRHTWEVDAASNELGSILFWLLGFSEAIGIPGLLDAIGLDAVDELVAIKRRQIHRCWPRLGHNSFFFFDLVSSSPLWSSLSSWNSWCSKWTWNGGFWTNEEDCSTHHVWNSL